jgi:hypothetical protein
MADKYIKQESGKLKEVEALDASVGAADAGKVVALDAQGKIDNSMMPTGIGADTVAIVASENLSAGDFVNIYDDSGTPTCRKADATATGKEAVGFVLDAVTSGAMATVYFEGSNNQLSGLVAGVQYLDATTAGAATGTPPSGSGNVVQRIGFAVSATAINVEFNQPIELV